MYENCSINDIQTDYISALCSVTLVLFGNVEFSMSAVTKRLSGFEFRVWQIVSMKVNTLKIDDFLKTGFLVYNVSCDKICSLCLKSFMKKSGPCVV